MINVSENGENADKKLQRLLSDITGSALASCMDGKELKSRYRQKKVPERLDMMGGHAADTEGMRLF